MKVRNLAEIEGLYKRGVRVFELSGLHKASKMSWALLDFGSLFKEQIVLKAAKNQRAVLDGDGKVSHVVSLRGKAHVLLENLEIRGGKTAFSVVSPYNGRESIYRFIDGAGVLISDQAEVRIDSCYIHDNEAFMCGGGISIQQSGRARWVIIRDCRIEDNRAGDTGSAIDLLTPGSKAQVIKTKISGNQSNLIDGRRGKSGQVTAFPGTKIAFKKCRVSGPINVQFPGLIYALKHVARILRAYQTFWRVFYPWVG